MIDHEPRTVTTHIETGLQIQRVPTTGLRVMLNRLFPDLVSPPKPRTYIEFSKGYTAKLAGLVLSAEGTRWGGSCLPADHLISQAPDLLDTSTE